MRKLLAVALCVLSVSSFAGMMDSISNVSNTSACMDKCDGGEIMKALGSKNAKDNASNVCKVACVNTCFSQEIKAKSTTEIAAIKCKDSLKSDLKIN